MLRAHATKGNDKNPETKTMWNTTKDDKVLAYIGMNRAKFSEPNTIIVRAHKEMSNINRNLDVYSNDDMDRISFHRRKSCRGIEAVVLHTAG